MQTGNITVSYFGVNQAYQLALAAQELGALDAFYCSLYGAPKKWGGILGTLLGRDTLVNRRCIGFDPRVAIEIPGPLFFERLTARFVSANGTAAWFKTSRAFDRRVARRIKKSGSRIFVGVETCAHDSFRVAGERGMIKVLDCPQVHPDFLTRLLVEAADDLGVPPPPPFDPPQIAACKVEEFAAADVMLVISAIQRQSFIAAGFSNERLVEIPLWVDGELWHPPTVQREMWGAGSLKALFVGSVGFRKGIPYLIQAVEKCDGAVDLTLVGVNSGEVDKYISNSKSVIRLAGRKSKMALREIYWNSDVLVLPSLIDTFGFVALEAMACGLPVIVTENCGVPVPDPAWRVPIMNSDAIAQRLQHYATNREALQRDGQIAQQFARRFTPERYREQIKNLYERLLTGNSTDSFSSKAVVS